MSNLETTQLGDPARSSSEVLAELKLLRQREGISARRIKAEASALTSLTVVTDQMEYRGFNPADRHLGAYTVVGCVIDHEVRDLLHRQILRISLRYRPERRADTSFQEAESVIETQQMSSLESRDLFAQAMLFLTKNPYERHREQAYQELADGLVMSQVSPCRESQGRVIGSIAADLMLETLLGLFSMEAKDELRDKLAGEVMGRLPKSRESKPVHLLSPSEQLAAELKQHAKRRYNAERRRRGRGPVDEVIPPYLDGKTLIAILLGRDAEVAERLVHFSATPVPDSSDPDFFRLWVEAFLLPMYSRSIRLLVRALVEDDTETSESNGPGAPPPWPERASRIEPTQGESKTWDEDDDNWDFLR